jgi:hypothetical protein
VRIEVSLTSHAGVLQQRLPRHPLVYEINTLPWLRAAGDRVGRRVGMGDVPAETWDGLAGYNAVWLMGVWQRSPAGVAIAMTNTSLTDSFDAALPGYEPDDVAGSPYCIRDYVVDSSLGGPTGLAVARAELARRGMALILDFVPNHVAPDHQWVSEHPERLVNGSQEDLRDAPGAFVEIAGRVVANGRDPYTGAWPDVVQLNAFSHELRDAHVATLRVIADQCDGVRCDMAMLMMNEVFARTWGPRAGQAPTTDYWPEVIGAVRDTHPDFCFLAEAYWDLEWELQAQGFDFCYDKKLYDRLLHDTAEATRLHLTADLGYQLGLLRFLENHDEPRAASVLSPERHRAAAVATLTQAGARLVHDGQLEGRRIRLPVFLRRFPVEDPDPALAGFYQRLLEVLADPTFRSGSWRLCDTWGWQGNEHSEHIVSWCWEGGTRWLVAVNLGEAPATAMVRVPWDDLAGQQIRLVDPTNDVTYDRTGDDLVAGLYVELPAWGWHLFRVENADGKVSHETR